MTVELIEIVEVNGIVVTVCRNEQGNLVLGVDWK